MLQYLLHIHFLNVHLANLNETIPFPLHLWKHAKYTWIFKALTRIFLWHPSSPCIHNLRWLHWQKLLVFINTTLSRHQALKMSFMRGIASATLGSVELASIVLYHFLKWVLESKFFFGFGWFGWMRYLNGDWKLSLALIILVDSLLGDVHIGLWGSWCVPTDTLD